MFHVEQLIESLRVGAMALNVSLDVPAARGMAIQLTLLEQWNARLNLVGPGEPASWLTRHSLDSLVPEPVLQPASRVLDLGSGAGFPGIPLALARPDSRFWLAERRAKRRAFLQNVLATIGMTNAVVIASPGMEERFDVVLGRAVLPAPEWLSYAASLVRPGGIVGLFAQQEAVDPAAAAEAAGLQAVGERSYALPGEGPRRFSWFRREVSRETP
jgi:16S rRNA (guanine527-N7)-methyltransferase